MWSKEKEAEWQELTEDPEMLSMEELHKLAHLEAERDYFVKDKLNEEQEHEA